MFTRVVVRFDSTGLRRWSAAEFLEEILLAGPLGAKALVVGYDFRFGFGATGDADTSGAERPGKWDSISVVPPVHARRASGCRARSSGRRLAHGGRGQRRRAFLGRPFRLAGGRSRGCPRANAWFSHGQPRRRARARDPGRRRLLTEIRAFRGRRSPPAQVEPLSALTVIGTRPSFGDARAGRSRASSSILGGDLYGKESRSTFSARLRGIVQFESPDELGQIRSQADVTRARGAIFGLLTISGQTLIGWRCDLQQCPPCDILSPRTPYGS